MRGVTSPPLFFLIGVGNIQILALDQSSKRTGFAIFKDKKYKKSGLIDFDIKTLTSEERFNNMCKAICDLIDKTKPELVVMEDVAFQNNAAALIMLARLQGVIIAKCLFGKIELYIYSPSTWRKDLGFNQGKGIKRNELKAQAIQYVKDVFGIDAEEDICEAICIGSAFTKTYLKEAI